MRELAGKLLRLDRRAIFVLIALATLIPLLYPVGLPIRVSYTRADGLFRQAFERAMLHAIEMTLRYRFGGSEPAAGIEAVGIH